MENNDDIPELEDFSKELNEIRKNKGKNNDDIPSEIKVFIFKSKK